MITALFAFAVGSVPTPGQAILWSAEPFAYSQALLAQAPTPKVETQGPSGPTPKAEEQQKLEGDMDAARKDLGHKDAPPTAPAPVREAEALESDLERGHRHVHADDEGDIVEEVEVEVDADAGGAIEEPHKHKKPKVKKTKRRVKRFRMKARPDWYEVPTLDGHRRGYYRLWGVVDWGFAGAAFAGHLLFGGLAIASMSVAGQEGPLSNEQQNPGGMLNAHAVDYNDRRLDKRFYREGGVALGVASAVLAIAGTLLTWRAQTNLDAARDLTEQEAAELHLYRSRRGLPED